MSDNLFLHEHSHRELTCMKSTVLGMYSREHVLLFQVLPSFGNGNTNTGKGTLFIFVVPVQIFRIK